MRTSPQTCRKGLHPLPSGGSCEACRRDSYRSPRERDRNARRVRVCGKFIGRARSIEEARAIRNHINELISGFRNQQRAERRKAL